ncbi:MAG: cyclase family protein [Proteobacteria bacterium]|nr:cyclase family protein [Pseudomonadota bacterium]
MKQIILSLFSLMLSTFACAAETWIDLTHTLGSDSVFWPTAAPFELITESQGMTEAGYYYSAYSFRSAEHGGTHIDAPVHFAQGRMSVDQIPLERLIGNACVIDVTPLAEADPDYQIDITAILAWESANGRIPDDSILLFRTGYGHFWPDAKRYLGTDQRGQIGVDQLHFPGLHPLTATWLVNERQIKSVGIDTASIDYGQSKTFGSHVILMAQDIPAFENLANLEQLPDQGAFIVALPVKIRGGSGGPLRIVARIQ